jgi:hypothetical protein
MKRVQGVAAAVATVSEAKKRLASLDGIAAEYRRMRVEASLTRPAAPPADESLDEWGVDDLGWFLDSLAWLPGGKPIPASRPIEFVAELKLRRQG